MYYLFLLYFALACFVANMLPMIFHRLKLLPSLKRPMDNHCHLGKHRLFGDHKTVRGLIVGVTGAILVTAIQWLLSELELIPISFFDSGWLFLQYGFLAGLGAILGDAIASLVKRQLNIKSGEPLIIFDQIDYVLGYLLLTSLVINWTWHQALFLILFALIANPLSNIIAYIFNIKKTYW